jgi:hypothetical protein
MGYDNENARRLVFDVECAALPDASDYLVEAIEAPSNWKDPLKIAAYVAEKQAEQLNRCALDPDLCRIVAVSVWPEDNATPLVSHGGYEMSEADILAWFWRQAQNHQLVGFNCLSYDLPVLLRRSLYLGISHPTIQIDKYKHPNVTDLMMLLSFNGALKYHSLDFYAKRFGCEVEATITGADIGRAVEEQRWSDIETHVLADVQKTAFIAGKLGLFNQALASVF